MAATTGTALYLIFAGVVLDTDYREFGADEEIGTVDQSAGSDTARTYLTTLTDGTASQTLVHQAANTAQWAACALGTEGSLEWGDEGTAAGKPRHYVNAIVTSRSRSMSYDDLIVYEVEWQYSGAVTDSTY